MIKYVTTSDWHRKALAGERVTISDGEPMPGYYKTKAVRGGPWIPARIWIEREVGDDGEQLNEDVFRCLVGTEEADPVQRWVWLSSHPITAAEYKKMRENTSVNANEPISLGTMKPIF